MPIHKNVMKLMRCLYYVNKAVYTVYPVWFMLLIFESLLLNILLTVPVSFMTIIDTSCKLLYFMHFSCEVLYKFRNY